MNHYLLLCHSPVAATARARFRSPWSVVSSECVWQELGASLDARRRRLEPEPGLTWHVSVLIRSNTHLGSILLIPLPRNLLKPACLYV